MPAKMEPAPPRPEYKRYAPRRAFPIYRFVPGLNPHPVSDPRGHSYEGGKHGPPPAYVAPENWQQNEEYLLGCDLYNFAYWWEAHEAWEGLWHLTPKNNTEGLFLQGLIQISASNLKRHMGEPEGSKKLATLGLQKLKNVQIAVAPRNLYMGLDVGDFHDAAERYLIQCAETEPFPLIQLEF
ncbi:MAG: DUF309 domain-containing protein [Planctomycetota bacterium]